MKKENRDTQSGYHRTTAVWLMCVLIIACFNSALPGQERIFLSHSRQTIGTQKNLSASVRLADIDGDQDIDILVANGRHWPQQNFIFLNHGRGRFSTQRTLGQDQCTSYATEIGDIDGDGDLDVVVGNDQAPNLIFLNLGDGKFGPGKPFGNVASVRSLTLADLDGDTDLDILATIRGS